MTAASSGVPAADAAPDAPASRAYPDPASPRPRARAWIGAGREGLAERISEFNRFPARYAHPSWVPEGWAGAWMKGCMDGGRGERRLGEELLKAWRLDARPCLEFDAPALRLALVDPEPLLRAVMLAGLARHGDEIARMLERSRVKAFREEVGEGAYRFAVYRAPLLAGSLGAGDPRAGGGGDWRSRSLASGLRMLAACLAGGPPGLAARAGLKVPRKYAGFLGGGDGGERVRAYARLFRKVLAQEVDPAWDSLLS